MKTQHVTVSQLPVSPAANESTTTMGVSLRERPGPDAIADLIADDEQLATLITQRETLGGAA